MYTDTILSNLENPWVKVVFFQESPFKAVPQFYNKNFLIWRDKLNYTSFFGSIKL